MENSAPAIVLTIAILSLVIWYLFRARARNAKLLEEGPRTAFEAGLATTNPLFTTDTGTRAPVSDFHVRGGVVEVTFDVPLPEEADTVLDDLLVSEAVEVVREKRHTLPLGDLHEIVVRGGRGDVREVGRVTLPEKGVLPPPVTAPGFSLTHVAHDPFAAPFEDHHSSIPSVRNPRSRPFGMRSSRPIGGSSSAGTSTLVSTGIGE